jgi:hypothetical protein
MRISIAFLIVLVGCSIDAAAADNIPKLNAGPSCEAAARGAVVAGRDKEACLVDERQAQEQAAKNWSQYRSADKEECVGLVNKGGPASYVELLSCLEVMRDARSAQDLEPSLFENGKLDVRKMDASVLRELGENKLGENNVVRGRVGAQKKRTKTGRVSQSQ